MFLTRCRDCSSRLLQLDRLWLLADGRHVARRRCPECGAVDHVTADPAALWAWRRQTQSDRDHVELILVELASGVREPELLPPVARASPWHELDAAVGRHGRGDRWPGDAQLGRDLPDRPLEAEALEPAADLGALLDLEKDDGV